MKRILVSLAATLLVISAAQAHAQTACQVRIPQDTLWAGPIDTDSSFGTITISDLARTTADYPGISSSTEVLRVDAEPYLSWQHGVKSMYAATAEGMVWIPYLDGGLEIVGYYVTPDLWNGPYPTGSVNLPLANHTDFLIAAISHYRDAWIPVRVWLTTKVC